MAQAPRVRGLQDDSVVEGYNLTLECSAEGLPPPELLWFKDGKPLASGRKVRIRTWAKRLRKRRKSLGRRTRSPALSRGRVESNAPRRRPLLRTLRRRHPHNRPAKPSEGGKRRTGRGSRRERLGRKENADRKRRLQGKRNERRRRIGRDGRRRPLPTTNDDAPTRRRPSDAERWNVNGGGGGGGGQAADTSSSTNSNRRGSGGKRTRPPPANPSRRVVQVSEVTVRAASARDAGQYKCVARSVVDQAEIEASIRVVLPIDPHTLVDKCPYDGYCLNGGTCMMFTVVGELVCQCAEGFKGQRCQEKEVYPTFNRNCHGPIRNLRHSQGRRCPRNQPTALWELLQQTLALRGQHKGTPWTKAQLLLWPTTRPGAVTWPP
ncbi:uncharacterized protein LOC126988679 [Eriocheir sinensis]|uniref:uncharacterized protein LOC126988679 n=1 Tax=Eriocheir sinensis TaxID=95602 RepID=UPI0021C6FBB2|nr:uncharacterized protein LOC126988679 [Eriocheir sinensis]